ncbi:hypothetical protein BC829DRAFT_415957 [Chytridium lagenaria]|nr:hypothetical protein BC829DRAFT_415957 [Chytridium lagenaria]
MAMTIGKTISFPSEPPLPPISHQKDGSGVGAGGGAFIDLPVGNEEITISSKLSNVESQRVMSVLQELQVKITIVDTLPDVIDRRTANTLLPETIVLIKDFKTLEERYKFLAEKKALREKNTPSSDDYTADLKETGKLLRTLTRPFVDILFKPLDQSAIKVLEGNQTVDVVQFESLTSNEVRALKDEVEKAKKERTAEVNKRNEIIRRLKEISSLQSQLNELTKKNREEEAQLRKKKFKIESEVENWIHKYDQDMEEKQSELEDLTVGFYFFILWYSLAIYMEEKAQLDELQARYNELQREYERIMEERRLAQEAKKEQEKQYRRMVDAATLIQAVWRGYRVRRDIAKKKVATAKAGGKKKK